MLDPRLFSQGLFMTNARDMRLKRLTRSAKITFVWRSLAAGDPRPELIARFSCGITEQIGVATLTRFASDALTLSFPSPRSPLRVKTAAETTEPYKEDSKWL
jgi:hypothetical protein